MEPNHWDCSSRHPSATFPSSAPITIRRHCFFPTYLLFFIQLCNDRIDSCSSCLVFFRTINNSLDRPSTKNKVFATEYRLLTNIPHSTCSHKPWSTEQSLDPPLIDASRAIYCRSKKRRRLPRRRYHPQPPPPTLLPVVNNIVGMVDVYIRKKKSPRMSKNKNIQQAGFPDGHPL